jgi:hypothetical protein
MLDRIIGVQAQNAYQAALSNPCPGFREYDRAIPVPEIFQVRCLETDELFDVYACNKATANERKRGRE